MIMQVKHDQALDGWLLHITVCCVNGCANGFDKANPKSFYHIPKKPKQEES